MLDHIDLKNSFLLTPSISPVSVEADTAGSGVDLRGCESEFLVIVNIGDTVTEGVDPDPDVAFEGTLKIQESLNNATTNAEAASEAYADITGATLDLASLENQVATFKVRIRGKRYVRAYIDWTAGAGVIGVSILAAKRVL